MKLDEGNVQTQLVALSQPVGGASQLLPGDSLQPGQRLLLPGAAHRVQSNGRVLVYVGADRVWGNEPSGSACIGSTESGMNLQAAVLGNPVRSDKVSVQIKGAGGGPLQLISAQDRIITQQQVAHPPATEQHEFSLVGQGPGVFLL